MDFLLVKIPRGLVFSPSSIVLLAPFPESCLWPSGSFRPEARRKGENLTLEPELCRDVFRRCTVVEIASVAACGLTSSFSNLCAIVAIVGACDARTVAAGPGLMVSNTQSSCARDVGKMCIDSS